MWLLAAITPSQKARSNAGLLHFSIRRGILTAWGFAALCPPLCPIPPQGSNSDNRHLFMNQIKLLSYHAHGFVFPGHKKMSLCAHFWLHRDESLLAWCWVKCFTERHCRNSYRYWRNHHD